MGEVGLREAFDAWVPEAAPLRSLAGEIATLRATEAVAFLSRVGCEPFNILANAQLASDWSLPVAHSSKTLLRWKGTPAHLHGFRGRKAVPARGLSLLFDPLVDAFLAAHFLRTGRLPKAGPTVLVLTDFYPLAAANVQGQDWAQEESTSFLEGRVSGRQSTVTQLFDALFGKAEWKENPEVIAAGITAQNLLVWNFFPMLRGGEEPTGGAGLPLAGAWRLRCWQWLHAFLEAVGANRVVLASSQAMLPIAAAPAERLNTATLVLPGTPTPLPALPCGNAVYRIAHPSSWKRVRKDGPGLRALLAG